MLAGEIVERLLQERHGRTRTTLALDHFCRLLREAGLPLERCTLSLRQLHPELIARTYNWDLDTGGTVEIGRRHEIMAQDYFRQSPLWWVLEHGELVRRRLEDPSAPDDFPILAELREQGYTDYRAFPLLLLQRRRNVMTVATRRPGGFSEPDLELLDACLPALATVVELNQARETAQTLLATYVGPRTGARVWEGTVRRGQGDSLFAVVLLCDLRGFTELAARQSLSATIAMLNDYFEAVGTAIGRRGGEILKFMGDALLAIFPAEPGAHRGCPAATAALAAAREGLAALGALNQSRAPAGLPLLQAGAGLAVGEVHYGNIGVSDRLDFTVIGPAVNLASRLQALSPALGQPILLSGDLAARLAVACRSLGPHVLKGVPAPVEVFAPAEAAGP